MPGAVEPSWEIRRVEEIDSTNRAVLDLAREGEAEGVVLVADHQTAGRGRLGRTWEAPPGASLLVTVLLRPSVGSGQAHLLTVAAALAAADACSAVAGLRPSLKWPNDLVVERDRTTRKLAGLLAESIVAGERLEAVALGMGLNVTWPTPLPADLADIATALNIETGGMVDRDDLLRAWLAAFGRRYACVGEPDGAAEVLREYRGACATLGRRVRVELPHEVVTGVAVDVADGGHLQVETDGVRRTITAGDVVHLR